MHENPGAYVLPGPLWRNRDYMTLLGTQTLSDVGSQVSQLAFPLLMLSLIGSPAQAGFLGAAGDLPYLFASDSLP